MPTYLDDQPRQHDILLKLAVESDRVDEIIKQNWPTDLADVSLIATGGYGRQALFPHSDIDLLVLYQDTLPNCDKITDMINQLWQCNLPLSHSVRSIEQCLKDCHTDLDFYTSILEARPLQDNNDLLPKLLKLIKSQGCWPEDRFFIAKYQEQQQRHEKYALNLEPNVKEAPGGLRDMHSVRWLALHYLGNADIQFLQDRGYITEQEQQDCIQAIVFLCDIRYRLHMLSGKAENRLLFDYQKELATALGYQDDDNLLAVEQFMQHYYQHTHTISVINEIILQLMHEALLDQYHGRKIARVNHYFQRYHDYLDYTDTTIFTNTPSLLIESYVVLCQHPDLKGFSARMIRALRQHSQNIDETFRQNSHHKALFMNLLKQPQGIYHQLNNMLRYGTLLRYIPAFTDVFGQMQFDLYHTYTVDRHTMQVLKELRSMATGVSKAVLPLGCQIIKILPDLSLLYLAALFHDIGKGRGCDHSTWGAASVKEFALAHFLDEQNADLVSWLVQHHLLMSLTAQKADISDSDVVARFAQRVQTQDRLNYLYLLTVADIRGTNITLWNGWRDSLLRTLYQSTTLHLAKSIEIVQYSSIEQKKQAILQTLPPAYTDNTLWQGWPDQYFEYYDIETIQWHVHTLLSQKTLKMPQVIARQHPDHGECEIFIYIKRQMYLFATLTNTIDALSLSIAQAQTHYTKDNDLLLSVVVLNRHNNKTTDRERSAICATLTDKLSHITEPNNTEFGIPRRRHRSFNIKPNITIIPVDNHRLKLHLSTMDYPGLLAEMGRVFGFYNLSVHHAQINTIGERADDHFVLGLPEKIKDPHKLAEELKALLLSTLGDVA